MATSRDIILNKLRAARTPFPAAPPRPKAYRPVTRLDDESPEALLERFTEELVRLNGEVFPVKGQAAARKKVLELLAAREAQSVLAWDFAHIPVEGLEAALQKAGISVLVPDLSDDRAGRLQEYEPVPVGLTGADGAIAATGSLVVSVAPGKGRIPTVLPRVHLAVITLDQIVPRLEDWVAQQRTHQLEAIWQSSNLAFITGPSRTADIEKNLVLGMHGPAQVQVIVRR